jgi:hypothetical protein
MAYPRQQEAKILEKLLPLTRRCCLPLAYKLQPELIVPAPHDTGIANAVLGSEQQFEVVWHCALVITANAGAGFGEIANAAIDHGPVVGQNDLALLENAVPGRTAFVAGRQHEMNLHGASPPSQIHTSTI